MVSIFSRLYNHNQKLVALALSLFFLFILSCEHSDGTGSSGSGPQKSYLSLERDSTAPSGQFRFILKTFVRDGVTVYQDGKPVGKFKKLWDVVGVHWGFRKKDDPKQIYWIQRNKSAAQTGGVQYTIEVDDAEKAQFVPQALPPDLSQELGPNLEIYAVVEINDVSIAGFMDVPTGFFAGASPNVTPPPSGVTPPPSGGVTPPPSGVTPPPSGVTPPPSGGVTPPPSGVTLTPVSSSELRAAWDWMAAATSGYQVKLWETDLPEPVDSAAVTVAQPASGATVTWPRVGLKPDTAYSFKVRAVNGAFAQVKTAKTMFAFAAPTGVTLVASSSSRLRATWNPIVGASSGYQMKLWKADSPEPLDFRTEAWPQQTSSAIANPLMPVADLWACWIQTARFTLTPNTSYSFRVRAIGGAFSSKVTVKTMFAAPTGVMLTANSSGQVVAVWDRMTGANSGYRVKLWQTSPIEPPDSATVDVPQPTQGLVRLSKSGLDPSKKYSVLVRAIGWGPAWIDATTGNVRAVVGSDGVGTATWNRVDSASQGYQVKFWQSDMPEPANIEAVVVSQPALGLVVWPQTGLSANTSYSFRVRAVNGESSPVATVTTK